MSNYNSIKVYEVSGDIRPLNTISVWDASSTGTRPLNSIPVWKDTNEGDRPLNSIQVKIVDKALNAIPVWFNGGSEPGPDPYNPLGLPPYTIRLKFKDGVIPTFENWAGIEIPGIQISEEPNIWDLTYNDGDWHSLLQGQTDLLEVLGANTTNVTKIKKMFKNCTSLSSVNIFDTSNITEMRELYSYCYSLLNVPSLNVSNVSDLASLYAYCYSLTSIPNIDTRNTRQIDYICFNCSALKVVPLLDTTNVYNCVHAFQGCVNVEYGALALYQQMATQSIPPDHHNETFRNCGINTQTGAAELEQIPYDWK